MTEKGESCFVGSTFEKTFSHDSVDYNQSCRELVAKAVEMFPPLKNFALLNSYAGVRCVTPQRRPMIAQVSSRVWVYTGMGSKGLLYHALLAEELVAQIKKM
jgi:glycine/D-amino acid oxidase-like deaminating enzyme